MHQACLSESLTKLSVLYAIANNKNRALETYSLMNQTCLKEQTNTYCPIINHEFRSLSNYKKHPSEPVLHPNLMCHDNNSTKSYHYELRLGTHLRKKSTNI